ncbi:unnamed protein product [Ixodes pacificus]
MDELRNVTHPKQRIDMSKGIKTAAPAETASTTPFKRRRLSQARFTNTSFHSPVKILPEKKPESVDDLQRELDSLKSKSRDIDQELNDLRAQGLKTEELDWHIEKLHEYNDVRDAAHIIIGHLAVLERVTVREKHEQYGLPLHD